MLRGTNVFGSGLMFQKKVCQIVSFQISKANDHGTQMRSNFSSHVPWASSGPTADEAADVYMNLNAQNRPMKQNLRIFVVPYIYIDINNYNNISIPYQIGVEPIWGQTTAYD